MLPSQRSGSCKTAFPLSVRGGSRRGQAAARGDRRRALGTPLAVASSNGEPGEAPGACGLSLITIGRAPMNASSDRDLQAAVVARSTRIDQHDRITGRGDEALVRPFLKVRRHAELLRRLDQLRGPEPRRRLVRPRPEERGPGRGQQQAGRGRSESAVPRSVADLAWRAAACQRRAGRRFAAPARARQPA